MYLFLKAPAPSYPAWWGRNHIRTNTILWADSFLCRTHFLAAAPSLPSSSWRQILMIIIMLMVMIMRWADELSKSFFCLNWRFFCTQILLIGFLCSTTELPRSQYRGEVKPQPNSGDLSISTQRCTSSFGVLASLWKSAFSRWISQFSLKNPTFFHAIYPPPPRRPPHSNRWKVSGENPALFPRRPKIGGMPWAVFGASWHFLSKASCLDRAPDKKAKPPIKRQILGSPDVLAVLLHWQLFLLFAPSNRVPRLAHSMKSQSNCFWTLWDRGEHFSKFFLPQNPPIPWRNDTGRLRVLAIFPN